jgi:hypothetical protein
MLHGAGLSNKCGPFAFKYFLLIHRVMPHGDYGVPHTRDGGGHGDISRLCTPGCLIVVLPLGHCSAKLDNHYNRGRFLGYTPTLL